MIFLCESGRPCAFRGHSATARKRCGNASGQGCPPVRSASGSATYPSRRQVAGNGSGFREVEPSAWCGRLTPARQERPDGRKPAASLPHDSAELTPHSNGDAGRRTQGTGTRPAFIQPILWRRISQGPACARMGPAQSCGIGTAARKPLSTPCNHRIRTIIRETIRRSSSQRGWFLLPKNQSNSRCTLPLARPNGGCQRHLVTVCV